MKRKQGFTLIEMLVVVVIIAILAGIIFKIAGLVGRKTSEAETVAHIGLLANAISEYAAEYGHYPPVPDYGGSQPLAYEYPPDEDHMDATVAGNIGNAHLPWDTTEGRVFTFGLMAFLVPRYRGKASSAYPELLDTEQWSEWNQTKGDIQRDLDAMERWSPYLDGILHGGGRGRSFAGYSYTNRTVSVVDGWDRGLHYSSPPPHESYKLWSSGVDGRSGTSDDIHAEVK